MGEFFFKQVPSKKCLPTNNIFVLLFADLGSWHPLEILRFF